MKIADRGASRIHGELKKLGFIVSERTVGRYQHPSADLVVQQLRDTFPGAGSHCYVILDRGAKFDDFLHVMHIRPPPESANLIIVRQAIKSSWICSSPTASK